MYLETHLITKWPRLSWVAEVYHGSNKVKVLHGPMVEVTKNWIAEAVWADDFESGNFDQTDLVFGTGIRCRGEQVTFVSSGTAMDRLWYCKQKDQYYVSNSLGGLSACAQISLIDNYNYVKDRESDFRTTWGLESCVRTLKADPVNANLIWFNNLVYNGTNLYEVKKKDTAPRFKLFNDYQYFLFQTAKQLKKNIEASARRNCVVPIATVSSGYDSPAASVVAKHADCKEAVTIERSSSFWRGSDSGKHIAEHLGMSCTLSSRTASSYPHETAFWAASGWANLLNWTLFPFSHDVSLMFQGNYGDAVWDRKPLPDPFTIEIWDDLAMGEFRLIVGVLQCPIPFWGMRHAKEINQISYSEEMRPWVLNKAYDRPIPRRLVEEAGVARGNFAIRKKNTSHEIGFRWPYSSKNQADFRNYLQDKGVWAPTRLTVTLIRKLSVIESLLHQNIIRYLGVKKRFRPWLNLTGAKLLFQWANQDIKEFYKQAINS